MHFLLLQIPLNSLLQSNPKLRLFQTFFAIVVQYRIYSVFDKNLFDFEFVYPANQKRHYKYDSLQDKLHPEKIDTVSLIVDLHQRV